MSQHCCWPHQLCDFVHLYDIVRHLLWLTNHIAYVMSQSSSNLSKLVEIGIFKCLLHHPKFLFSLVGLNHLWYIHTIHAQLAQMIHYTVCNCIWVKRVRLNGVDCTVGLSWKWSINWIVVWIIWSYDPSKYFTCTKPIAHVSIQPSSEKYVYLKCDNMILQF